MRDLSRLYRRAIAGAPSAGIKTLEHSSGTGGDRSLSRRMRTLAFPRVATYVEHACLSSAHRVTACLTYLAGVLPRILVEMCHVATLVR